MEWWENLPRKLNHIRKRRQISCATPGWGRKFAWNLKRLNGYEEILRNDIDKFCLVNIIILIILNPKNKEKDIIIYS